MSTSKLPFILSATLCAGSLGLAQTSTTIQAVPPATTTVQSVPGTSTTQTTTTTIGGLVSEMGPEGIVVRGDTGAAIRYSSSARTVFVDEAGQPVAREVVTSGVPVTVHYSRVGDGYVAERVVVRRMTTSTTTPGTPTVIERNTTVTQPPTVVEKKVYVDRPVVVEKPVEKKVYVDRPVVVEKPVEKKVYVDRPVIVEKPVVVEKRMVPEPAPAVIEERKTTTTTTTTGKKKRDNDDD